MSQLTPNNWMTLEGTPVTGATPPRLIVVEGVMTDRQRALVLHEYTTFCLRKTNSICEHLTENRVLSDGTRVFMESMQGKDRVMVWPAATAAGGGKDFIAVQAYVNLGFAPIFERPVINLAGNEKPPYPEEPEFELPFPERQYAPNIWVRFSQEYGAVVSFPEEPDSAFRNITYRSVIEAGGVETYSLDGSLTWTSPIYFDLVNAPLVPMGSPDPENPDKFYSAEYNNAGANPDDLASGERLWSYANVYFFIRTVANSFSNASHYKDFVPSGATGIAAPGTRLHGDPEGGQVDYTKGAIFLKTIEQTVGRDRWDAYLRSYFDRHAFQPQTTAGFLKDLRANLIRGDQALEAKLQLDRWAYEPGMPDNAVHVKSPQLAAVERAAAAFAAGGPASAIDTKGWSTQLWQRFIARLPRTLAAERLADLDRTFHLSEQTNGYIRSAWLELAIANRYEPAVPSIEQFLTSVGRTLLVRPLYQGLKAQGDWGMTIARRVYAKARSTYHPVTAGAIDKVLGE